VKAKRLLGMDGDQIVMNVPQRVAGLYRSAYGDAWYEAMTENGRLLWMRRNADEWWTPEWYDIHKENAE